MDTDEQPPPKTELRRLWYLMEIGKFNRTSWSHWAPEGETPSQYDPAFQWCKTDITQEFPADERTHNIEEA